MGDEPSRSKASRNKDGAVNNMNSLGAKKAPGDQAERSIKSGGIPVRGADAPSETRESAEIKPISAARAKKLPPKPKPEIVEQIGQRLRSIYNDVVAQPVPDRFHDLLRELESGAGDTTSGGKAQKDIK
jgi:hypothetical protein